MGSIFNEDWNCFSFEQRQHQGMPARKIPVGKWEWGAWDPHVTLGTFGFRACGWTARWGRNKRVFKGAEADDGAKTQNTVTEHCQEAGGS